MRKLILTEFIEKVLIPIQSHFQWKKEDSNTPLDNCTINFYEKGGNTQVYENDGTTQGTLYYEEHGNQVEFKLQILCGISNFIKTTGISKDYFIYYPI